MPKKSTDTNHREQPVTLRTVADYVGLAPCSVSAVLNNSPAGMSIPQQTRERIWRAARQLNYRPNYSARALRTRRTYTVAMLVPDIGYGPAARIAAGAENFLRENDYCMILATCDHSPDWQHSQLAQLRQRGVEGLIVLQANLPVAAESPAVSIQDIPHDPEHVMTPSVKESLTMIGRKAATQLVRQIESASRSNKISDLPRAAAFATSKGDRSARIA
jgi:LacI family transcriptional regulator